MKATEKMDAFGLKALAEKVGKDLVTIYRWRRALNDGRGLTAAKQRLLIEATAHSTHAITWLDFLPSDAAAEAVGAAR